MHNVPDSHEDLLQSSVASLATIGKNGHPQLTEVWFYYEDGSIAMSLNSSRQKVKSQQHRHDRHGQRRRRPQEGQRAGGIHAGLPGFGAKRGRHSAASTISATIIPARNGRQISSIRIPIWPAR